MSLILHHLANTVSIRHYRYSTVAHPPSARYTRNTAGDGCKIAVVGVPPVSDQMVRPSS